MAPQSVAAAPAGACASISRGRPETVALRDNRVRQETSGWHQRKEAERALFGAAECSLTAKMSAAAAMKAGFFRTQADCTETNWSQRLHASGPFHFGYDYQRADLDITGPDPYPALLPEHRVGRVIYTSGGMAAIATVLITLRAKGLAVHFPAGVYAETKELAGLLTIPNGDAVTFIDSAAPVSDLDIGVNSELAILDTSCFVATSGKLRSWAPAGFCITTRRSFLRAAMSNSTCSEQNTDVSAPSSS